MESTVLIQTCCLECGKKYGKPHPYVIGVWRDTCQICGKADVPCGSATHDFDIYREVKPTKGKATKKIPWGSKGSGHTERTEEYGTGGDGSKTSPGGAGKMLCMLHSEGYPCMECERSKTTIRPLRANNLPEYESPRTTCPKTMTGKHHWSMGMYDKYLSCQFCGIFDDR